MKKLMKIAFGMVAFAGACEIVGLTSVVAVWVELMQHNEDAAADAIDNDMKRRRYPNELKVYNFIKTCAAKRFLNH